MLALQSSNSPHRRKHHLEQEIIQGQATKEKMVSGKKAGGNLLKEEFCHVRASCFFFLLKYRFVSVHAHAWGVGLHVSRIFNLLCLPHRRWESAHDAQQFPKPYGRLGRRCEKSMWGINLNRRLSSGISIVAQQHAYHESLSNVPEGFFSQDYTIKASQYHSVVLILKKKCENRTSARAAHILLQKEGEKQQLALHENLAMKSKSNANHSGDHLWNKAISKFLDKMDVVNFCCSNNKVCSCNSHVAFQDLFPHQKLYLIIKPKKPLCFMTRSNLLFPASYASYREFLWWINPYA